MYEGWDEEKETQNRSTLVGKTMLAGMESSTEFHENEASSDEMVKRRCKQSGKSIVAEGKQRTVQYNRDIQTV